MDIKKIEKGVALMMEGFGIKLDKDLAKTPKRVAEMYAELLSGEKKNPEDEIDVVLEQEHDEIILLKDIALYSLCEHHLLPFIGKVHVAYIPDKRITGLSKITRVVDCLSKRLQVQERLTAKVAEVVMKKLQPKGVMVIIEARHLCMEMRGTVKSNAITTTSVVRGVFRTNQKTRQEALSLIFAR
jgi:GTP cyclohydrolase I